MTATVSTVHLLDVAAGVARSAELRDAIEDQQIADWESEWAPAMREALERLQSTGVPRDCWPQDAHWDWRRKLTGPQLLADAAFSVVCDGVTQGMMILDTATRRCRIEAQKNLHLVYVRYLQSAPWNRASLCEHPRYRGIGSILIRAATALSEAMEFKGRIGLHSLPQAEGFYTHACGMTDLAPDPAFQNLRYFEMTPQQARAFIDRKGPAHARRRP